MPAADAPTPRRSAERAGAPRLDPDYAEALAWLFAQRRSAPRDPGRARDLLAALAIPSDVPAVHVVGTTGKGTVAAMVERGLRAEGRATGRFTSPHVEDFRERIEVAGTPIPPEEVVAFVRRVRTADPARPPAFFEIAFAMALDAFARRGVELAVVEAGVGARADATRALDRVVLAVVTNVSMDHAATLGGTVAAIARDKAEAVRPGVPVVTGATGVARAVLETRAAAAGSPFHADPPGGDLFAVPPELVARDDAARAANQRLAAAALRLVGARPAAVAAGVTAPALPARRERFAIAGRTVVLDGAHNPAGAAALARSLPDGYVLVFGALGRKDGTRTLRELAAGASRVIVTEAASGEGIVVGAERFEAVPDPVEAIGRALRVCPPGGTIAVAGSLYLAGRVRPYLRRERDDPPPESDAAH